MVGMEAKSTLHEMRGVRQNGERHFTIEEGDDGAEN